MHRRIILLFITNHFSRCCFPLRISILESTSPPPPTYSRELRYSRFSGSSMYKRPDSSLVIPHWSRPTPTLNPVSSKLKQSWSWMPFSVLAAWKSSKCVWTVVGCAHFFVQWLKVFVFVQNIEDVFVKIGLPNATQLLGVGRYRCNPFSEVRLLLVQAVCIALWALPGLDLNTDRWQAPVLQIKSCCVLPSEILIGDHSNDFKVLTKEHDIREQFWWYWALFDCLVT